MEGKLYIVGTPIGNREDITLRALRVLFLVDVILCEDTRKTRRLLETYEEEEDEKYKKKGEKMTKRQLERFDDYVERSRIEEVIGWLREGKQVALVSNAGMPVVSDPGFLLVRECYAQGIEVEVVPGASALTAAMAIAGVPVDKVLFLGFLPKKAGKRGKIWRSIRKIQEEAVIQPTVVIYESPYRLRKIVEEIGTELDDPEVVLLGELTKMYEKRIAGRVSEVMEELPDKVKGEWVVVVGRKK